MENLEFVPLGKFTEVNMKSSWNNPSFEGAFLPLSREITEDGFTAQWKVNYFNRSYPQEWEEKTYDPFPSAFGVKLLVPVDEYQKTMRTSKYGLMIIVLTFLSFFMIELFSKKVIHPIQYLLVGLALIIFYSILLAISEYILFQYSYLISSLLIIALIGFYAKSIYQSTQISIYSHRNADDVLWIYVCDPAASGLFFTYRDNCVVYYTGSNNVLHQKNKLV